MRILGQLSPCGDTCAYSTVVSGTKIQAISVNSEEATAVPGIRFEGGNN